MVCGPDAVGVAENENAAVASAADVFMVMAETAPHPAVVGLKAPEMVGAAATSASSRSRLGQHGWIHVIKRESGGDPSGVSLQRPREIAGSGVGLNK